MLHVHADDFRHPRAVELGASCGGDREIRLILPRPVSSSLSKYLVPGLDRPFNDVFPKSLSCRFLGSVPSSLAQNNRYRPPGTNAIEIPPWCFY